MSLRQRSNMDKLKREVTLRRENGETDISIKNESQKKLRSAPNISVYYQNVGGMKTKIPSLSKSVACCDYGVLVFTETWWNKSISCQELGLSDYDVFRVDRDCTTSDKERGGGVMIASKKCFAAKLIQIPDNCLEQVFVYILHLLLLLNIGFGTPATDVVLVKAFFNKLREESPTMITFSFDCQKNLVNPKVQDQIAYYSRQLYTYNFTVVKGSSHSKLNKENVTIYTWMEHEYRKGSNEIASAVFHTLSSCDLSAYSKIRLCADGCGGQNRNSTMIAMCVYFLKNIAPHNLKCIEIVFPIRSHSFLPSDRVF
nr:unnamed protein product [Callosobruchus analis]